MNPLRICICAFLVAFAASGMAQEVTKKEAAALRDARALRKEYPEKAKAKLVEKQKELDSKVLLFELGLWHAEDGEDVAASAAYRALLKNKPDYPGAARNLGIILLRSKRYDEATKVLSKLSRREDLGAELQRSLGVAFSTLGNHTAALAAFRRAVVGFPNDDALQVTIAQTLYQLKSVDEGEAVAREVLRRSPKSVGAWMVIGNCNASRNRYDKAVDALEAARRLSEKPSDQLLIALGDLYVALEMPETAWKRYSAATKGVGSKLSTLGRQFIQDGDLDRARKIADTLAKNPANTAHAHLLTGLCELNQNRLAAAEKALTAALKDAPTNGEILVALGDLATRRNDITKAISWYRSARQSKRWKQWAMGAELNLYLTSQDYDKARRLLTELNAEFPSPSWDKLRRELPNQ